MRRPWHTWLAFGCCLAIVLAAMGWTTVTLLRLDAAEARARRQTAIEEEVRLGLWRMDSALAPLIAQESGHPYFVYVPFYPADRAYTRMFAALSKGDVLVPSPLLTQTSPYVLLHFQISADGSIGSPQVPTGNMRDLAESSGHRTGEAIQASGLLLEGLAPKLEAMAPQRHLPEPQTAVIARSSRRGVIDRLQQEARAEPDADASDLNAAPQPQQQYAKPQLSQAPTAKARSGLEAQARERQQEEIKQQIALENAVSSGSEDVAVGVMQPTWLGDTLVLARRVRVNGEEYVQGCQLDWEAIRQWLLGEVHEVLPEARLEPATNGTQDRSAHRLAALPVELIPGTIPLAKTDYQSTVRLPLLIAWVCVLLATAAVMALLRGAVVLSERRGAFVSAVTHEMRTPLTTFRLYTELLEDGRVKEQGKVKAYLTTLRTEAERLSHLVENVLAYARLERGRQRVRETVAVAELVAATTSRLTERARQANMQLVVDVPEPAANWHVQVDRSTVEQILMNLVDNACKYAFEASDRTIRLTVDRADGHVTMAVRDFGRGVAPADRRDLFRPFHKSAAKAANTAPGVGLGLSISRRLARDMGGDLDLDETVTDGARFVLTLPERG